MRTGTAKRSASGRHAAVIRMMVRDEDRFELALEPLAHRK